MLRRDRLLSCVAAFTLALGAGQAHSADAVEVVTSPSYNWSGAYIGAHLGYRPDGGYIDEFNDFYFTEGVIGGIYAGYNWQFDQFVLGLEGDWSWTSNSLDETNFDPGFSSEIDGIATLRGRAGLAFDRFLVYGTGGVAFVEQTYITPPSFQDDTEWHTGWVAGVGGEVMVTPNILARAEYLYVDPGETDYNVGLGDYEASVDPINIFRLGVSFKFGN